LPTGELVCLSAQNSAAMNATKTATTATLTIIASAGISHLPR
jgi:hypothetical protein